MPSASVDGVVVDVPSERDAGSIGRMHLLSWHQTYPDAEHGVDTDWIDEHIGFLASDRADDFRRRLFVAQQADPTKTFYRVARARGEVVGFVHASRPVRTARADVELVDTAAAGRGGADHLPEDATLEALYLLRHHLGTGLADRMMAAVLDWAGDQAMRLEVAGYNARAIGFYERFGFRLTGEGSRFRERVPIVTMRRAGRR